MGRGPSSKDLLYPRRKRGGESTWFHRRTQNFSLAGEGAVSDFKYHVMKVMSESPSRHPVMLQGKLKLTEKEKTVHFRKLLLHFSKFRYTSHQLILVAVLGCSINRVKPLKSSCLQNLSRLNFAV
jgi:hypothetical protein